MSITIYSMYVVKYIHCWVTGYRKDLDIQEAVLDYYGAHLHCAMQNRKSELDYLRATLDKLFPYILPLKSLKCRYMYIYCLINFLEIHDSALWNISLQVLPLETLLLQIF